MSSRSIIIIIMTDGAETYDAFRTYPRLNNEISMEKIDEAVVSDGRTYPQGKVMER